MLAIKLLFQLHKRILKPVPTRLMKSNFQAEFTKRKILYSGSIYFGKISKSLIMLTIEDKSYADNIKSTAPKHLKLYYEETYNK